MSKFHDYFHAFLELFYPRICLVCGQKLISSEEHICLKCLLHLPRTNYHDELDNPMEKLFYGRVHIERATTLFEFRKGSPYQKILHHLKYKGLKEVGEFMGKQLAIELRNSQIIRSIDLICAVPLHPKKERKRGYNQSFHIAKGLSKELGIPVEQHAIRRKVHTSTQTKKSRIERWENVAGIFEVPDPSIFEGKHVLLVDDVVTTGATLEACAHEILSCPETKVSLATLAIA